MRRRKRTMQREVRAMKEAAFHEWERTMPGVRSFRRDAKLLFRIKSLCAFGAVAGLVFAPLAGLLFAGALYGAIIVGHFHGRAYQQGSVLGRVMFLDQQIALLDAVCEQHEQELAPHHPERVLAHKQRANLVQIRKDAPW